MFFVTFFPQLIAGPIVHHREIVPQLRTSHFGRFNRDDLTRGGLMFLTGLYKKVVFANGIAPYADSVFAVGAHPSFWEAWGGSLAYALQIYFDFSGYSDMALGLGLMFGLRLPVNFNSPYKATSIIDFWRRWHITLSHFLRDCLYIPLGGNRHGPRRRHVNLMLTMLLGGLWHGAGWTFIIWGGLHGFYLIVNHSWNRLWPANHRPGLIRQWTGRVLTLLAVTFAWVFFRAPNFDQAMVIIAGMIGLNGVAPMAALTLFDPQGFMWEAMLLAVVWFLPNPQQTLGMRQPLSSATVYPPLQPPAFLRPLWQERRWLAASGAIFAALAIVLILTAPGGKDQPFIYMIF